MSKRGLRLTLAAALGIAALWSAMPKQPAPLPAPVTDGIVQSSASGVTGSGCSADDVTSCETPAPAKSVTASVPVNVNSSSIRKSAKLPQIPAVADLRREASEDPHATPESLIRYSIELGRHVRASLGSEEAARGVFRELRECVANGDVIQAQTLCLSQAKTVKDKYSALDNDYETLLQQASPRVRSLARLID